MSSLTLASSSRCKKERGYLLAFRIVIKEYGVENSFHTTSVTKHPHGSGSSFDFLKCSLDKVRGTNLSPQGLLSSLKFLCITALSLLQRKFHLIKRKQIIDF